MLASGYQSPLDSDSFRHAHRLMILRHVFAGRNAENAHPRIISQAGQEFRSDEEVLTRMLFAGDINHALVNHTFVSGIHSLIDFVDDPEWSLSHALKGHQEENGRNGSFTTGLTM